MSTGLTGRERVARMFARRDHDRVPRSDSFWKETLTRWESEGLTNGLTGVQQLLQVDLEPIVGAVPAVYRQEDVILSEDAETKIVRDPWGGRMRYWKTRSGTPEHLGWECDSRQVWEDHTKPAMLARTPQDNFFGGRQLAELPELYQRGRAQGRWLHIDAMESFELLRRIIGDEATLIGMAEDPEWIRDMSATATGILLRDLNAILATGIEPDGLWVYGDMAFNHGTVCSPAMYKELIWPDHKRLADWAHAHGMKFIFHTDGDVNAVLDLYLAAGFDCLQPLEAKAHMDVRRLAPLYGDRLAFFGNIDVTKLVTNDRATIEAEVREKLAAGMAEKSYIYHSDHSVPPQVSWETYQFIIKLLDRYGNYR